MKSLGSQIVVPAPPETKIRLSLLSTAMVDALGGPAEFRQRFSFPTITSMIPNGNFNLPPGVWTDDTSMALCLAHSLSTSRLDSDQQSPYEEGGGFDEHDQMAAYTNWRQNGFLSAVGRCFDVGTTVSGAISFYSRCDDRENVFEKIKEAFGDGSYSGNGSLMRVIPVGLAYWRDEKIARQNARRSSTTTHPNELCQEACEVWTGAISMIMKAACSSSKPSKLSKLQVLEYFATFPYTVPILRDALSLSSTAPKTPEADDKKERHYRSHHPIMKLIAASDSFFLRRQNKLIPRIPNEKQLPSSGYVLNTLIAALYSFLATSTFEEGAIFAVNLGDDADTVGAVYGGLAGCWYGHDKADLPSGAAQFWSERVESWRNTLVERGMVEEVAEKLVSFSARIVD